MPDGVKPATAENAASVKKKKSPRIRNRARNKCNRIQSTDNSILTQSETQDSSSSSSSPSKIKTSSVKVKELKSISVSNSIIVREEIKQPMQSSSSDAAGAANANASGKSREQIVAEREAKKLAKQAKNLKAPTNETANATASSRRESKPPALVAQNSPNSANTAALAPPAPEAQNSPKSGSKVASTPPAPVAQNNQKSGSKVASTPPAPVTQNNQKSTSKVASTPSAPVTQNNPKSASKVASTPSAPEAQNNPKTASKVASTPSAPEAQNNPKSAGKIASTQLAPVTQNNQKSASKVASTPPAPVTQNNQKSTSKVAPTPPAPVTQNNPKSAGKVASTQLAPVAQNIPKSSSKAEQILPVKPAETKEETMRSDSGAEKSRDLIKAEREAKKLAKQAAKAAKTPGNDKAVEEITQELSHLHIDGLKSTDHPLPTSASQDEKKKPALTKAERRAIQEAQRAAKAQALSQKKSSSKPSDEKVVSTTKPASPSKRTLENTKPTSPAKSTSVGTKASRCKVKLFNHLENAQTDVNLFVNSAHLHPSIVRLGEQYAKRTVVGSNARCIAFMNALKLVIQDFETPPKKEFSRSLEADLKVSVEYLQKCRPLAVSVSNAHKHIKHMLTQLPTDKPESELKEDLCHFIDSYIENQIGKAAQAISSSMQEKIKNGDVILTFGCSSLINYICEEAHRRSVDFRVIVVDSRPFCEGQELLRRLTAKEIPCTYVLINAIGFVMPEATKVLLGAHALLSNGYVMARTGTAQVALVANTFNVPVLVCCETHKFSERFQTDAIVYNELGDPHDLVLNEKCCLTNWEAKNKMTPLNLIYDITPPELVTAVVTEVSILPCTSVPVILRIKPTEIGYYS